ncbi:uncharacterized protein PITG_04638 [Phytophthora infestans T30-4]|uniref:DUF155 domain-containing protein n=2 Tax=Phytophthora infestans TaxID=4787 RepID=D0N1P3_PHYIT|nr:uncharacterized protein PITG_04638 [Phytophthora infestans T30-4]EEY68222.1 conserved hypothetical protein [Phytophthora infestans T30-4]KAF4035490.1 putative ACR/YagE family protein [Phytophthora infestans]KAF4140806.1 putative ACR/YagE family protein [Phytophthora infestans]|eukprot:XP_002905381.1 conserved hypothetical protein [Phytophthora infestans T30-4]
MSSRRTRSPPSQDDTNASESSPLLPPGSISLNYNSDSAVYDRKEEDNGNGSRRYFGADDYGTSSSSSSNSDEHEDFSDLDHQFSPTSYRQQSSDAFRQIPRTNWHGLGTRSRFKRGPPKPLPAPGTVSHTTRRSRMRTIKKQLREPPSSPKLRVSAYCTCDQLQLFKLLKWLERVETGQLPGGELHPDGWRHKMYMGAIHSSCAPAPDHEEGSRAPYHQKDAFYFATGCAVFWGLTRAEEQAHLVALGAFSVGPVKQVEVEDMDYTYGDASLICNDAITLSSNRASEKLAVSFAMAQSSKLDVFEERVEETIRETKHVPQNLAATGSIQYSQSDISKLIGRLFIERSDVNLNSDMLDEPDFFWEDDEYEPLYKKVMKYLSVDNRVQILNTRLDILRELLDVLSQQLAHQHDTKLEMIVIWLIVAEVAVQVVWNILIKDILGFFPHSDTE